MILVPVLLRARGAESAAVEGEKKEELEED